MIKFKYKLNMMSRFVMPVLCFFILVGCNKLNPKTDENSSNATSLTGIADFDNFYYRFHSDSIFQINHVQFPLQGIPSNAGELEIDETTFRWKKEDWVHHNLLTNPSFESNFQILDESLITEYILSLIHI